MTPATRRRRGDDAATTRYTMTGRSKHRERELETIHPAILSQVTGGRVAPRTTLDPVLLEGFKQLSQAIMSVGQSMAAAKQSGSQQMMQMVEQMMQSRGRR
jgi:hypothetical protein